MHSAPQFVAVAGFVVFAATGVALGHTILGAQPIAPSHHQPQARPADKADYQPVTFTRMNAAVQSIDTKERTVTLDNGGTYVLPPTTPVESVRPGARVTVAAGRGIGFSTAFLFVEE